VLRQAVARKQPHLPSLLEREQTDAVELALEDPLRPRKALLRESGGHRLDPFRKGHEPILARHRSHGCEAHWLPLAGTGGPSARYTASLNPSDAARRSRADFSISSSGVSG